MPELSDIKNEFGKLNMDNETKKGVINLIDLKTNSDMEKVLFAMKNQFSEVNAEIKSLKSEVNAKIKSVKNEGNIIKWIIGVGITLAAIFSRFFIN